MKIEVGKKYRMQDDEKKIFYVLIICKDSDILKDKKDEFEQDIFCGVTVSNRFNYRGSRLFRFNSNGVRIDLDDENSNLVSEVKDVD
jgi:hypothetical protein